MSKTKEWYMKQEQFEATGSSNDEDYLYEQYLMQEKMNEQYWEGVSNGSIFPENLEYTDEYYKKQFIDPYHPTKTK